MATAPEPPGSAGSPRSTPGWRWTVCGLDEQTDEPGPHLDREE